MPDKTARKSVLVVGVGHSEGVGAAVARRFAREGGTIIFTGASGSLRGKAGFGGFAQSKAALRAVDGNRINTFLRDLKAKLGEAGLLRPEGIAENCWHIHCQPKSAWTHELDVRPWVENW